MPRDRRIVIPGGVYHIIIRGLERKKIFADLKDRQEFLNRLAASLVKTKARCYAWVLMPNHVHLMVQTTCQSVTDLMRKVLTGYAVYFNQRHNRHGYLYQNRYKSILCQDEVYFHELLRYIHLNPIRAKILQTMNQLDCYPWSGHICLIGGRQSAWQSTDEVLSRFGKNAKEAVQKYKIFMQEGLGKKNGIDFSKGRFVRVSSKWSEVAAEKRKKEFWRGDQRILGDDVFIAQTLKRAEESVAKNEVLMKNGWNIEKVAERACAVCGIGINDLKRKGRANAISKAKGLLCFFAHIELGMSLTSIGRYLSISQPAVSKSVLIGKKISHEEGINLLSY